MFYPILRSFVRFGMHWYVPDLRVESIKLAQYKEPALVVSNHPNSLFDALILAVFAPVEIRYLARGDMFKNPIANVVLRNLFMLPIYKKSDDPDYLVKNDFTYDECIRNLQQGKHVLLFPEGRSHNLWHLQHFMNGGISTLLERAIKAGIPLQVQPYVLHYSSFKSAPKALKITALPALDATDYLVDNEVQSSTLISKLREALTAQMDLVPLQPRVISAEKEKLLRIPAKIGYYTQYWFYKLWRDYVAKKTKGTIFFDSILFVALLFTYPILVFLISFLIAQFAGFWFGLLIFLLLPATAYCLAVHRKIKTETDTVTWQVNYFSKEKK